jgi:hypothetical protein
MQVNITSIARLADPPDRENGLNALNPADAPDALNVLDAVTQQDQAASAQDQGGPADHGASTLNGLRQLRPDNLDMALLFYRPAQTPPPAPPAPTAALPAPSGPTAAPTASSRAPSHGAQGLSARASDQRFYDDKIADAANPASAIGYAYLRALNNAGHDIADGAQGMYTLATDANARARLASSAGNTLEHPADTAASMYNAGKNYLANTSGEQMGEDALRFVAGALAGAGAGKVAQVAGQVAKEAALTTGGMLASGAAQAGQAVSKTVTGMKAANLAFKAGHANPLSRQPCSPSPKPMAEKCWVCQTA